MEAGAGAEIQTVVERRRSARAPVTVRIEYGTVDSLFSEFTRNINEGGLFIETEAPLELGERVRLQFQLPGSEQPIRARGRVAWVRGSEQGAPGMGIEFEDLDRAARQRIDELIRALRAR